MSLHQEHHACLSLTFPLVSLILDVPPIISRYTPPPPGDQIRKKICQKRRYCLTLNPAHVRMNSQAIFIEPYPSPRRRASSWLIGEHGFALHKRAFQDSLAFSYGWIPKEIPVVARVSLWTCPILYQRQIPNLTSQ